MLVDTREHESEMSRILPQIIKQGYTIERVKLDTGDYAIKGFETAYIDRKHNLDEVLHNLCSPDSGRFWREIRRSKAEGIKLYFLVEHSPMIKCIEDVSKWSSKYSRVTGRQLMERMYKAHIAWGVEWIFCSKRNTGKRIVELLEEEQHEHDSE